MQQITLLDVSGTVTFDANLTYSSSTATTASVQSAVPMSCLPSGATCSDENSTIDAGGESVSQTCVASASNCVCNLSETLAAMTITGTYSTSGTMVTTNASTGTASTSGYCVQGNTLYLIANAMTAGGTSTPAETLVATRQ